MMKIRVAAGADGCAGRRGAVEDSMRAPRDLAGLRDLFAGK